MTEIGFNRSRENDNNNESIYESFIGKPGHYGVGPTSTTGILKEINLVQGYISVQPSIVGYGNSGIRLEKEYPTIIGLNGGGAITMRPLKEGDLEIILKESEDLVDRNKEQK